MSKRRSFTPSFKSKVAIEALKEHKNINDLVEQFKLHPAQIKKWKAQAIESLPLVFEDGRHKAKNSEPDIEVLYAQIGKLQTQLEFLKKKPALTSSEKRLLIEAHHPELTIRAQCVALGLARSSYYYNPRQETKENLGLMRLIEELHYAHPEYGYRKIHATIRRNGQGINEKRIERLWKQMGFKSILPRKNLSKASKGHLVYPYCLNGMWINRPNQVFSSDITFLPMRGGFVYLVMIVDWFSRYILSWEVSNTMTMHFCLEALEKATHNVIPEYFNTDQGSQFTSQEFLEMLEKKSVKISMDGKGRAIDNVYLERGWWSLKYEKIYLNQYETLLELIRAVKEYVEHFNNHRPHQALQYATPHEIYHGIPPKYSRGTYRGFKVKQANN